MMHRWVLGAVIALALSGCGKGDASADAPAAATKTQHAPAITERADWKATDACAILDKGVVAATLGTEVKSAALDTVKNEGGGFDLYSQCTFMLGDGRMLVFGSGQATNGASVAEQVAWMRRQAKMISDVPPVDLPGVGKAALWAAETHQLWTFLGDGRFASATLGHFDLRKAEQPVEQVKTEEIAVLRKIGA